MPPTPPPSAAESRTTGSILSKNVIRRFLPLAFWLLLWAAAARLVGQEFVLPGPVRVFTVLLELAGQGAFWRAVLLSLARMVGGICLGTLLGAALAVLGRVNPWVEAVFAPAIQVVRAVPVASFILLVLLWVARSWVPVAVSALMVLPVVWAAVRQGLAAADPQLLELARCYRMSRWKTARLVYLPALAPAFSAGLATAMGLAWKSGVAAEVLCTPKVGLGTEIYWARQALESPALFAWTLAVVALSLLMERLMGRLLKRGGAA